MINSRASLAVLLFASVVLPGCGKSARRPYVPRPHPKAAWEAEGDRVTYRSGGVVVSASILEAPQRQERLASLGLAVDPFSAARNGEPFFMTIWLQIENGTPSGFYFNPAFVTLKGGLERLYPKSVPELWKFLVSALGEERTSSLEPLIFGSSVRVASGERIEGFLVFTQLEGNPHHMNLEIRPLNTGTGDLDVELGFERAPEP